MLKRILIMALFLKKSLFALLFLYNFGTLPAQPEDIKKIVLSKSTQTEQNLLKFLLTSTGAGLLVVGIMGYTFIELPNGRILPYKSLSIAKRLTCAAVGSSLIYGSLFKPDVLIGYSPTWEESNRVEEIKLKQRGIITWLTNTFKQSN